MQTLKHLSSTLSKQLQDIKLQKSASVLISGMELNKKANGTFNSTTSIATLNVKVQNP